MQVAVPSVAVPLEDSRVVARRDRTVFLTWFLRVFLPWFLQQLTCPLVAPGCNFTRSVLAGAKMNDANLCACNFHETIWRESFSVSARLVSPVMSKPQVPLSHAHSCR